MVLPQVRFPDANHVREQPKRYQRIIAALVLEQHVDEAELTIDRHRVELIAVALDQVDVHKGALLDLEPVQVQVLQHLRG